MSFEALLEDEVNQRKGFTYILDESGFRLHHLAHVNLRDVQRVNFYFFSTFATHSLRG